MARRFGWAWVWAWVGVFGPGFALAADDRENLALGKAATASRSQDEAKAPAAGNDGDPQTRWCAADDASGDWWQVDLGRPETLTGVRVTWEADDANYRYKIEGSPDAKSWRLLSDQTATTDRARTRRHDVRAEGVRYVRLTVTGLEPGHWASFYECEVFGTKPAPAGASTPRKPSAAGLMAGVKVPKGFKATLFAAPPDVRYPACLAAAPSGEVFVGVDENGSLDARPARGRVVRCVDKDGDGDADAFNDFVAVDSPRGLAYDAGTLYVLHPPDLTAYHDDNGDGVSDRAETLVKNIGFDLKFRGADHTTNGIRLAIDGFLYIAVGDYGFTKAVAKDGTTATLRGGGIARVRPDGTGFEVYSRGQRNIYDVAVDPFLNVFTRDNTNDGGGWDVRLSHVVPTANMGYPSLFTNFGDEIVQPLADYGGGSPTGSLYLQEPGFPDGYGDTLYTCDWGRSAVYRHPLKAKGAGFTAGQVPFVEIPRPTDIDVDGLSNLYISSWKEGGFTYSGPNVGFVIRITPEGPARPAFPDLAKSGDVELVKFLSSGSAVVRQAAQREMTRRGPLKVDVSAVAALAVSGPTPPARFAAMLTVGELNRGGGGQVNLPRLPVDDGIREATLKALADRADIAANLPAGPFREGINDPEPRVRLRAAVGIGRLGQTECAGDLVAATADADPLIAHAAVEGLVNLAAVKARTPHAIEACLAAIDPQTASFAAGAAKALQQIHDVKVVDGLVEKLSLTKDDAIRRPVLKALCRLFAREADWDGKWWGTRPDTSGPYFQPVAWAGTDRVAGALRDELSRADDASARWLLGEMLKNKVEIEGSTRRALALASSDPSFRAATVGLLGVRPNLPPEALAFLGEVAGSEKDDAPLRAKALRGLFRAVDKAEARDAAVRALAAVGKLDAPPAELLGVWHDFVRDNRQSRDLGHYVKLAEGPDADPAVLAYAVILQAEANPKLQARPKTVARDALARAWAEPALSARLLRAVGQTRSNSFAVQVRDRLESRNADVRAAAAEAARRLGLETSADGKSRGPLIAKIDFDKVVAGVQTEKGDPALGARLFERVGCVNCHTVAKAEGLKGPYLGDVADRYGRAELTESILKPSAKIAQGFETQKFATANGQVHEGFVVRESGEEVEIRNGQGAVTVIPKAEIEERGKGELSVMPNGLADTLTVPELAAILAYFESLKARAK